jgi:hypothetical protein
MERNIYVNALGQTSLTPRDGYTLAAHSVLDCDASPDAHPLSHFELITVSDGGAVYSGGLIDRDEDGNPLCAECGADHSRLAFTRPECSEIASDFTYDDEYAPITRDDIQR